MGPEATLMWRLNAEMRSLLEQAVHIAPTKEVSDVLRSERERHFREDGSLNDALDALGIDLRDMFDLMPGDIVVLESPDPACASEMYVRESDRSVHQYYLMPFTTYAGKYPDLVKPYRGMVCYPDGTFVDGETLGSNHETVPHLSHDRILEENTGVRRSTRSRATEASMLFAMMADSIVVGEAASRQQRRAVARALGIPSAPIHKVVRFPLPNERTMPAPTERERNAVSAEPQRPLHMVRGHWREYADGRRIWIRAHWRGSPELGVIYKTYKPTLR